MLPVVLPEPADDVRGTRVVRRVAGLVRDRDPPGVVLRLDREHGLREVVVRRLQQGEGLVALARTESGLAALRVRRLDAGILGWSANGLNSRSMSPSTTRR